MREFFNIWSFVTSAWYVVDSLKKELIEELEREKAMYLSEHQP